MEKSLVDTIFQRLKDGVSKRDIARELQTSETTVYKYINKYRDSYVDEYGLPIIPLPKISSVICHCKNFDRMSSLTASECGTYYYESRCRNCRKIKYSEWASADKCKNLQHCINCKYFRAVLKV